MRRLSWLVNGVGAWVGVCLSTIFARGAEPVPASGKPLPWLVPDAPFRYVVTAKNPPAPSDAGWAVEFPELGQTLPNAADVLVLDSAGKSLPFSKVFRAEGQRVSLVVKDLRAGQEVSVYFGGGKKRAAASWNPRPALWMEVRRMAPGTDLTSLEALENAWKNSAGVDGGGFVNWIAHSDNLFGEGTHFMTRYRGWLKPGASRLSIFTASSDASFVWLNGKLELSRPGKHPAMITRRDVTEKTYDFPDAGVLVEYLHAKGADGVGVTRFGYLGADGKVGIFDKEQWARAGTTEEGRLEHAKLGALGGVKVEHPDYIGWDGLWLFDTRVGFEGTLPEGCKVQWEFGDGARAAGAMVRRMLSGLAPVGAIATISKGTESVKLGIRISNGGPMKEVMTTSSVDRERYLERIVAEDLGALHPEVLKVFYRFVREFGTDEQIGKVARAWIEKNPDPSDPLVIGGLLTWLRGAAQMNPKQALVELAKLDAGLQKRYLRDLSLFELDTRVFLLKDSGAVGYAEQLIRQFEQEPKLVQLVRTRIGDLLRLQGKLKEAEEAYRVIQKSVVDESGGRKYAAQDRAFSVTVGNLIAGGNRVEAEAILQKWEGEHPTAKLQSDFLLLRGRVLMMFGRWGEALQEIESFKGLNPDSPFQIPADFYRAKALAGLGQVNAAKKIWLSIANQYPKHELAAEALKLSSK